MESELFGYEKNALTGAIKQTKGKIEYAEGSTFFLDEVGDLQAPHDSALFNLRYVRGTVERQALLKAMSYTDGNLSQAADLLGITWSTLYTLLNTYQLEA